MTEAGLIAIGAGLAIGLSAIAAGLAEKSIGTAAIGALAEKEGLFGKALLFSLVTFIFPLGRRTATA